MENGRRGREQEWREGDGTGREGREGAREETRGRRTGWGLEDEGRVDLQGRGGGVADT